MPDDVGEAIGIIHALGDAGLLRTAGTPESQAPSDAVRLLGALRQAGLLADPGGGAAPAGGGGAPAGGTAPGAQAAAVEGPQEGDTLWTPQIPKVNRHIFADGRTFVLLGYPLFGTDRWYWLRCRFPPNNDIFLEQIDKVLVSPRQASLFAMAEVTAVLTPGPPEWVLDVTLQQMESATHVGVR